MVCSSLLCVMAVVKQNDNFVGKENRYEIGQIFKGFSFD